MRGVNWSENCWQASTVASDACGPVKTVLPLLPPSDPVPLLPEPELPLTTPLTELPELPENCDAPLVGPEPGGAPPVAHAPRAKAQRKAASVERRVRQSTIARERTTPFRLVED